MCEVDLPCSNSTEAEGPPSWGKMLGPDLCGWEGALGSPASCVTFPICSAWGTTDLESYVQPCVIRASRRTIRTLLLRTSC